MKKIIILSLTFFVHLRLLSAEEIEFKITDYKQLFKVAQKENKPVLLYFHFDGCGACLDMEKNVFINDSVAQFYNQNFITFEINTLKGDGVETNKIYNVKMHPTFLYLDKDGKQIHKIVGVFKPTEFIDEAKRALHKKNSLSVNQQKYASGERNADFLYNYCYQLSRAYELDALPINEYLKTQTTEELSKEKNLKFIYEFTQLNHRTMIPFNSREFQFMVNNQPLFDQHFDPLHVDGRIVFLTLGEVNKAIANKDELLFNKVVDVLTEFDKGINYENVEMNGKTTGIIMTKELVLPSKIEFYLKTDNKLKFKAALKEFKTKLPDDANTLNNVAWSFYELSDDKRLLKEAKKLVEKSISLNSNYYNNDTYAAILHKLGKNKKALQIANKAVALAKQNNINPKDTQALIEKIKAH